MKSLRYPCLLACILWCYGVYAQSVVEMVESFHRIEYASVLTSYQNEFGDLRNHNLDVEFPYALIRVYIDGDTHSVKRAKELFSLYLGLHYATKAVVTDKVNQILFLVPANAAHVELQAGDGFKPLVLVDNSSLKADAVYDVRVRFDAPLETNDGSNRPIGTQYFKFRVMPVDATIWLVKNGNKEPLKNKGGMAVEELQYGKYSYIVESDRYHAQEGVITVSEDAAKNECVVRLRPRFGWLNINSSESSRGAYAYATHMLTDKTYSLGEVPFAEAKELDGGEYRLMLQKDRYKDYETNFYITEGDTTALHPTMEANYVRLTLLAEDGVAIYKGVTLLGTGFWTGDLECGTYQIETRKSNHTSSFTNLEITKQSANRSYSLKAPVPIVASLKIDGEPYDAAVYVDGVYKGATPIVINDIIIGEHELRIEQKGYMPYQERLILQEGVERVIRYTLNNNPQPIYQLGVDYYYGRNGKTKDYSQAAIYFRQAAEMGDADAQNYLGICYYNGIGVEKDYVEAVKWYRKAAEMGDADAQNYLGICYYNGIGVEKDYVEAVKWYRKAAEQGEQYGQYNLGRCYQYGQGVTKDLSEAKKWYQKAADQGHEKAKEKLNEVNAAIAIKDTELKYQLANDYYYGQNGKPQDYSQAVIYFRQAAEMGHADAQNELGWCYQYGQGVKKDYVEAVKWYRKSAEQGHRSAQNNLGNRYYNGEGVTKDYVEAAKWYRKAAEQGEQYGQYNLGICYYNGEGVEKDYVEAVKWYRKSAEQGHRSAQNSLGRCYHNGQGVEKDYMEAVKWYRKAAEQRNKNGQFNLGWCYQYGQGVTKDLSEAKKWYQKAADQGHEKAKEKLKEVEALEMQGALDGTTTEGTNSIKITKPFEQIPNASATGSYGSIFGQYRKPMLDIDFPYAVVRIKLEGDEKKIAQEKDKFSLYLGQHYRVVAKNANFTKNEILFLIPYGAGFVELKYNNSFSRVIINSSSLQSNTIYFGTIRI